MGEKEDKNTEQAILKAAEEEFLKKGYALSKTTDIAKQAGVTHAMLHYYFRTKENLFEKVFSQKVEILANSFKTKFDSNQPFDIKLKQAVETHFDFVAANPQIPFFIINELLTNPKRLHDFRKMFGSIASSTLERIQSEINIEIQKGSIKPINAIDLIFDIISLNIFTFLVSPVIFGNKDILPKEIHEEFIQKRREEHVKLILARIKY
ncbi:MULTISPECIES: TetR/AcrR family transcriptional regulator [Bacteroidales]|jgi:regulatory protein|uniref:TetR/AcrR family transcriptional regulator n=1 Tax=Bacteroidales TaxID=171549 RepID=UPI0005757E02|nr:MULTISPECIES: TetR/AcrR family transcriptional regulator [Bacteroidales]KHM45038.1 hypothetical protein PU94_13325 [Coprobacter secundus]